MNPSFFSDLLTSIADRGRAVLARPPAAGNSGSMSAARTSSLSPAISSRGVGKPPASPGRAKSSPPGTGLDKNAKRDFLIALANDFGPDARRLDSAIQQWREQRTPAALQELHAAAEPKRQEVIRRLNLAPRGTSKLVRMREELFEHQKKQPVLDVLDEDFTHLFSSWFNPGFLVLRRIDWSTPANILEKIIRYEAVHAIRGWDDLRRRIEPEDRRLFAFFHPQMVDDPLIFVEVALTDDVPDAIEPLLAEGRHAVPAGARDDRRVLLDLELPEGSARRLVRKFPHQARGRGIEARTAEADDVRHAVTGAGVRQLARPRAALRGDRAVRGGSGHSCAISTMRRGRRTRRRVRP